MTDFVHLHVHSHYSLLDGLVKIKPLVKAAKDRGLKALALTDYGSLYGAIEFYKSCVANEIKPIIGMEAYLPPRSLNDKDSILDKEMFHLVLLAKNYVGYKNLMRLSSIGHLQGFFNDKPRLDKKTLAEHSEGIIILSGCIRGEIPQLLKNGNIDDAKKVALEYKNIFGSDFYLELQDHLAIEGQLSVNEQLIDLGKELNIQLVVTRDVHYLDTSDAEAQDILTCIREGWKVNQLDREDFRQVDRSLNTGEDIASRFRHVPDAIENTVKIAEQVDIQIPLSEWYFPEVELPEGKRAEEVLRENTYKNLPIYFSEITDEIKNRVEYELRIILEKGYAPYFVCVADYVGYAKKNGIVETTRGSAAGSIVSYVNGITTVDPLRFNLPFERFLNPFRPSPPDIDTDFADDRRDEMIEYVTKKYGVDRVAQIITFGTMAARASVRDVGRALGYSYSFCDQVAKLIPFGSQGFPMTIDNALEQEPDLKKLYKSNVEVNRLLDLAKKVEGCARHTSIHAAGVVISPKQLTEFTPIQREVGGEKILTQYDMHAVEDAGLLKYDFLGIRNLSILGKAVQFVEKTTGEKIDIYNLPLDNKKTFEMLTRGETMGTFQLGGSGMTRWLKELQPSEVDDLMAMIALFRPGPMAIIPEYIARKHGKKPITYYHPKMEKFLARSYGLLVYQDDLLFTAIELAGYDWITVDKFRKAVGKKIPEEMRKQHDIFVKGCQKHSNMGRAEAERIWDLFEPFQGYGFNKCLVGDTEVVNPDTGEINKIADLAQDRKGFSVLSLNDDFKFKKRQVYKVYKNGKKKVWKLKTRTGREITATANHPFLKFKGWCNLGDLQIGDLIAVPRNIVYKFSQRIDKQKLKVLGYLLAEGNLCHPNGVYFYSSVKEEITDFIKSVSSFRNSKCTIDNKKKTTSVYVGQINQTKGNELFNWLKELNLIGKNAREKSIPQFVFGLSQKQLPILIGAMWQGDGCIHPDKGGQIYYASSSKKFIQQLQHLLLRLEIISTIHTKQFKYRGQKKTGYTLNISRYNNIQKFVKLIGPHLLTNKREVIKEMIKHHLILRGEIPTNSARGTKDIIPADILSLIRKEISDKKMSIKQAAGSADVSIRLLDKDRNKKGYLRETILKIAKLLGSKEIKNYATSDIYWDEVISIEYDGMQDTYDLTVPEDHNFVANDLVVHNSHAASYGIVAYQTSYMKANYPVQYMTAVLQAEAGDAEKIAEIVHECRRMGIKVLPPDVNESFRSFAMISKPGEPGIIRFGLNAVKNVGEHICDALYSERKENGQYGSVENLLERVDDKDLNKKSLESLIQSGAMDCFGYDRGVLLANSNNLLAYVRQVREKSVSNQKSLFADTVIAMDNKVKIEPAPEATLDQKLVWEKNLLGLYVSSHPFEYYQEIMKKFIVPLSEMENYPRDEWIIVGGVVDKLRRKITKKGGIMLFITLQDTTGSGELMVFPKTYEKSPEIWQEGAILCIMGRTPKEEGDTKMFVEKAAVLTKENALFVGNQLSYGTSIKDYAPQLQSKCVVLSMTKPELAAKSSELKKIFEQYPGEYQVYVKVGNSTIRSHALIDWNSEVLERLEALVGDGKVEVYE